MFNFRFVVLPCLSIVMQKYKITFTFQTYGTTNFKLYSLTVTNFLFKRSLSPKKKLNYF
jgi:hypothetical protein